MKYKMKICVHKGNTYHLYNREHLSNYYQNINVIKQDILLLLNSNNEFFVWGELIINKKFLISIEVEE